MRLSQFHLVTQKESPAEAEIISHQLMLRAGMIRRVTSGIYSFLPLGLRVIRKIEAIVREEMNRAGALEVLMPSAQPAELWQESGRWVKYGPELLRFQDRHQRDYCLGPTHEEVITDIARAELRSYRQLPINFYQIQTKFRDEIRPRFGMMRSREFIMKDGYSFHSNPESLAQTYEVMRQAYQRIFDRIGLGYRAVAADTGSIGGDTSMEFHVLADSGEDAIVYSTASSYAANQELAAVLPPSEPRPEPTEALRLIDTPDTKTIAALVERFSLPIEKTVKTLIVKADPESGHELVALIVRGDHELNAVKAENIDIVAKPLEFASETEIRRVIGAGPGSLGPINLPIPCLVDHAVAHASDFGAGANIDDKHYFGINWGRDLPEPTTTDLRNIQVGDPAPDGSGPVDILRGIEVGHIFQLGQSYSKSMDCTVLDENGKATPLWMGCYGIGISRIAAAAIEQNYDQRGMIWPLAIAPFQLVICPLNAHKSQMVAERAEQVYQQLINLGVEVLFDDRNQRPGVMFSDQELIGIPYRLVISERGLAADQYEFKARTDAEASHINVADFIDHFKTLGLVP